MAGNNTINYYNNNVRNAQFSAQRPEYTAGQPQLAQQAMEGAQDTYVAQRAENVETDWMTIPATILAWFGICKGTDYFNNKLMSKEYSETPLGKLGTFGDRVTEGYRNSKFAQSSVGQWLHKARTSTKTFIHNKVVGKNPVLSSIRDNPTIPEWGMPYTESKGLLGKHTIDVKQLLEGFMADPVSADHLERVGYTKEQIKDIKQEIKTKGFKREQKLNFLKQKEAEALKCSVADLKNARAQALGFNDAKHLEGLLTKLDDHGKEVMEALDKIDSKKGICFVQEVGEGKLGFVRKFLFKRKVTTQEIFNKYKLVLNEGAAKSKLGRILSKGGAWFMEGATNRFAGGKMVALMQAVFVAQAFSAAITKGEGFGDKVKTFIERFNELVSYIFSAALGVFGLYHVAGMKYAGMNKDEVKAYREAIKKFNEEVVRGDYTGKKQAYKDAWKKVEAMRFKDNGFFTRMFQRLGGFLNVGNEQREVYKAASTINLNPLRKFGHWFRKTPLSFAVRGLPIMLLIIPFVAKVTTKCSNAIFGKPKHSLLDEEKEAEAAEKAQKEQEMQAQLDTLRQDIEARQQAGIEYEQQMMNNPNGERNDMLNPYRNLQNVPPQEQPVIEVSAQPVDNENNEPQRTYIPSSEGVKIQPEHTYVPSSDGVKVNAPDYSAAEQALAKSAAVENEVMRVLSMK